MRQLRVLHVIESLAQGGAEQNLLQVARHLPRDRFQQDLAWFLDDARLADQFRPHVDSMIELEARSNGWLGATWRLVREIRRLRPDVIHVQLVRASMMSRIASILSGGVPVVTTWQNAYYNPHTLADFANSELNRQSTRVFDALTSRVDSRFVAVSEYVADHLCQVLWIDRAKVDLVYNTVADERFRESSPEDKDALRSELGLAANDTILLSVGRLVAQKAHTDSIAALQAVVRERPRARLLIAGAGPLEAELRAQIIGAGLQSNAHLLGPRHDVSTLLQIADLFVFPSLYEGHPVALVEAMANGLPAVVSRIPPSVEAARGVESVRLVPEQDPDALARGIGAALDDLSRLREIARDARAEVRRLYSASHMAQRMGEIFESVARGR